MRIVIALGGNALLQRNQPMSEARQRQNVRIAAAEIARIAPGNELVIAHGNGPQVGLLALQAEAYAGVDPYPLDVLGAESEGMIGYVLEQELMNVLPERCSSARASSTIAPSRRDMRSKPLKAAIRSV